MNDTQTITTERRAEIVSEAVITAEYLLDHAPAQDGLCEGERIAYQDADRFGPDQHSGAEERIFLEALVEALGERQVPIIRTGNEFDDHFHLEGQADAIRQGMLNAGIEA